MGIFLLNFVPSAAIDTRRNKRVYLKHQESIGRARIETLRRLIRADFQLLQIVLVELSRCGILLILRDHALEHQRDQLPHRRAGGVYSRRVFCEMKSEAQDQILKEKYCL